MRTRRRRTRRVKVREGGGKQVMKVRKRVRWHIGQFNNYLINHQPESNSSGKTPKTNFY